MLILYRAGLKKASTRVDKTDRFTHQTPTIHQLHSFHSLHLSRASCVSFVTLHFIRFVTLHSFCFTPLISLTSPYERCHSFHFVKFLHCFRFDSFHWNSVFRVVSHERDKCFWWRLNHLNLNLQVTITSLFKFLP